VAKKKEPESLGWDVLDRSVKRNVMEFKRQMMRKYVF